MMTKHGEKVLIVSRIDDGRRSGDDASSTPCIFIPCTWYQIQWKFVKIELFSSVCVCTIPVI
jgi:hypothetical protein